ncbi:SMP-30/gluconolactonase/LRE family protein [Herbiconiux sp. CPCC 205763]|uniref:SMP-30/gluconolactonase/LRE family protein n=1 Tax=Herbiconiux aconitum TaxID=2970913 RepID=A0ABT2GL36_9MICO|nr:SMP-30/gluconolactonase/LRE family protein [Herbiconiux aconitum]MCS5716923.1 SMP-30/gluconolactonase/LRE family protein [Herbiconiux aconitum]
MTRVVDVISGDRFAQGESPRWDARHDELVWVDMATGTLHRGTMDSAGLTVIASIGIGGRIGCAAPISDDPDGLIVAADRGFLRVGRNGELAPTQVDVAPEGAFMNDGGCDPAGRFWAGTQSVPRAPHCSLYSLEPDGTVIERLRGVTVSNGLSFSADGRTLYYIDTLPDRAIDAFDVDARGRLGNRRRLAVVEGGNPDGLAIDEEGALWVAVWDAGQVRRYASDGRLLESIDLPAVRPTAVAFVGSTLMVTTASVGLPAPSPEDGAILAVALDVGGAPASPYGRPGV